METQTEQLRAQFIEGLKDYLQENSELNLTAAYELGRQSLQDGYSELDVIKIYHEALYEIDLAAMLDESIDVLDRTGSYLVEWLAPFEVRLRSYKDLIKDLNAKNEQLEEEIQNRKKIEKELQRSKRHFQSLIENAQDIITVLDQNGIIRYTSPSIERILGYTKNELWGRDAFQYIHPADVDHIKELFTELVESPDLIRSEEYRYQHKNGHWIYLESIAKQVNDGDFDARTIIVVNSRNVTERNKAIQKLRESEAQLSEAQRIAKVGSWEWIPGDVGGVKWSDEMCRIYGVDPEDFNHTYETFLEHVHPADRERTQRVVGQALKNREPFSFEHRIIRKSDGKVRQLLGRGQVITDDRGEVVKMIGTGQDITEQKEREQKLRDYSDKLRKLSARIERTREDERIKIAREVHDELGQMLTVLKVDIAMLSDDMREKLDESELKFFQEEVQEVHERIDVIIKSVQRITTELRPEVLDDLGLKDALEWQAHEFEDRTGIEIHFRSDVTNTDFLDDELSTTLFRIFQETLTNIVRHAQATKIWIRLEKEQKHLLLIVKDNGVGITQEEKNATSSLGLIGMRERTQFLGGDVKIEGEKDKGTTVTLRVPFEQSEEF